MAHSVKSLGRGQEWLFHVPELSGDDAAGRRAAQRRGVYSPTRNPPALSFLPPQNMTLQAGKLGTQFPAVTIMFQT
jgi:hypothetical protein